MLKQLAIRNYAIIEEVDFHPGAGLNVITGETGAGKSILLGALGLILGQRADHGVLKDGDKKCTVEAVFDIGDYGLKPFFEERDLDYADDLLIRREILPAGKSRAFINDTPARLADLQDLSAFLVDLHQQFSALDIYRKQYQLELLDAMSEDQHFLNQYRKLFSDWKKIKQELDQTLEKEAEATKEFDFLSFQFEELDSADLQADEREELEGELSSLENFEEIKEALNLTENTLEGDQHSVNEQIKDLVKSLSRLGDYNHSCRDLGQRLDSVQIELEDIARTAAALNDQMEFEPARLEFLRNRIDLLFRLMKKHHLDSTQDLIILREKMAEKLREYSSMSERIDHLKSKESEFKKNLESVGLKLSEARKKAAEKLQEQSMKRLESLSMPYARLKIELSRLKEPSENGLDEVVFLFSANKGMDFRDLRQVASGGEVSRLNLSIKSAIAGKMKLPTLIFDEIDSGVSGDVALKMGKIMKQTAAKHQIIVITHSPQVAACGERHFFIHKTTQEESTKTHLKSLSKEDRINHIAVMLSADPPTTAAIENAKELINLK